MPRSSKSASIQPWLTDLPPAQLGRDALGAPVRVQPDGDDHLLDQGRVGAARRAWCSRMIERGVIVDRPFFPTLVHSMDDVTKTIEAARSVRDV